MRFGSSLFSGFLKNFNASGIAANPNLVLDWLITMPWYLMMTFLLWYVVTKYRFSLFELILLGGIYEFWADGILGNFAKGELFGPASLLLPLILPLFMTVYSPILLFPNLALRSEFSVYHVECQSRMSSNLRRYFYAMLPLLGLIPYFILFIFFMS